MKANFIILSIVLLLCLLSLGFLLFLVIVGMAPWWVLPIWLAPVCLALVLFMLPKGTQISTSRKRTEDLLDIHSSICPKIPFNKNTGKIIMFSDLHRGMGEKDVFQNNKELFKHILEDYYKNEFTLVLIGDMEEGWGFKSDNIPLILDAHADEFEVEKKFQADNRYYRIYGNHDDFFRGHLINFEDEFQSRVFPAITFYDNGFTIFITHGCQGQGLHDAGDETASWGVYVKYNYFLEIFHKKLKSQKELIKKMAAIESDTKVHEKMVYDWALNNGKKKCNILVNGHTHIPVFNSIPRKELYQVILQDIKDGKYMFFNDIFEKDLAHGVFKGKNPHDKFVPPDYIKAKMMDSLNTNIDDIMQREKSLSKTQSWPDPFYFNTGCGFHSKISCIEISDGKIYLKLLSASDDEKGFISETVASAELTNY